MPPDTPLQPRIEVRVWARRSRVLNLLEAMMTLSFAQSSFPEVYRRALVGPLFRAWVVLILEDATVRHVDGR